MILPSLTLYLNIESCLTLSEHWFAPRSVTKVHDDGSQSELSMFDVVKAPEKASGIHKLSMLKTILKAKISEQRAKEYQSRREMAQMEQLEEDEGREKLLVILICVEFTMSFSHLNIESLSNLGFSFFNILSVMGFFSNQLN